MSFIGDFPEDFTTVSILFTTHAASGAPVAPSSGFEAADVAIFKNGSATEKTTTNGLTMTSPFNGTTGLHCLVIDTSNDTGDGGFWVAGAQYTVVLVPDETVDSLAVAKVIGTFGIELAEVLRPVTAGRQIVVDAAGLADANAVKIGPTGSGTAQTARDIGTSVLLAADQAVNVTKWAGTATTLTSGLPDVNMKTITAGIIAAASFAANALDAVWSTATRVLTAATNLSIPTANNNADALLDRADGVETGLTPRQALRLSAAADAGKLSGAATTTNTIRNAVADSKDRIVATVDSDGNRTAITYDLT